MDRRLKKSLALEVLRLNLLRLKGYHELEGFLV